jgi:hypothetical protein
MAKTQFRMLQWNTSGANNKLVDVQHFITLFDPSVICLNETWFYPLTSFFLQNYAIFRQDRELNPTDLLFNSLGGGVAILIREGTTVIREARKCFSGERCSEWLSLDIIPTSETSAIRIITGYCPPKSSIDLRWLASQFDEASNMQMPCFFAGDINARSPVWGREPWNLHGSAVNNMLDQLNLHVISTPATCLPPTGSMSTLDLWIVNNLAASFASNRVKVSDRLTSTHFATFIDCNMPHIGYQRTILPVEAADRFNIAKADRKLFHNTLRLHLEAISAPEVGDPIERLIQYREDIINAIRLARDVSVPLCTIAETRSIAMSGEMRAILAEKRIVERELRDNYDPDMKRRLQDLDSDFKVAKKNRQTERDIACLRRAEALSAKQRFHEAWMQIRKLDRASKRQPIKYLKTNDGRVLEPSKELANELLLHFTAPMSPYSDPNADDVVKQHWQRIEDEVRNNADLRPNSTIRLPDADEFSISHNRITRAVFKLKAFKAPGIDGILNVFYKWGGFQLQNHLRRLYNFCLGSQFSIPAWKHAAVVPVPKPGKPAGFITSQRPISLLPTDGKLLESMTAEFMSELLDSLHLLPENQYAFRKFRSAPDIPLRIVQRVFDNRSIRHKTVVVTLDVQAAYDSVWHAGLISKLLQLPLPRNLIGWLTDFLRDRKLQARVAGHLSDVSVVNCGVPQGSPISPLLYILYTADLLVDSTPGTITEAYADDLTTTASGETMLDARIAAQIEINRISRWAQHWRQKFNSSKSESIPLYFQPTTLHLHLDKEPIPQKSVVRILGIHFDQRLTFKPHVDRVVHSCRENLRWFRRLVNKPGLSRRWRRTTYYSLIRSKLTYGHVALSTMSKRQFHRLEVVQNNCLRSILNVRIRDQVRIDDLQNRCRVPSLPAFISKCQKRYISNAVQHVLPIRENVEAVRLGLSIKGPMLKLAEHLGDEALPPPT